MFVELLISLTIAARRYKPVASAQKNGDICVAIV
jgi:hypothetical protein